MEKRLKTKLKNGGFGHVSPERSRIMSSVKSKGNLSTERRLRFALVREGISGWEVQCEGLPGKPDFYFPRSKTAIFVDGCFWHGCPECGHIPLHNRAFWAAKIKRNMKRDIQTNSTLNSLGVGVLRFWEHDVANSLKQCVVQIECVID
jgi:DNA mismatch endonuclease (patch repair protein)